MNKITKPIIVSALSALAFGSLGVAGTFALFTDKAETQIAADAGVIAVSTNASIHKVFEYDGTEAGLEVQKTATDDYTNSIGGTTKKQQDGTFALGKWAPGDRAQIKVTAANASTVKAKVRLKAVLSGELAGALVVKIGNDEFTTVDLATQGARTLVTDWLDYNPGSNPANFGIEVSFPNVGTEITSRDEGENNLYQGKSASLLVTYEAVQANASVTSSLLERANTILATNSVKEGANATFSQALSDFTAEMKAELIASPYVYGIEEDQFYETSSVEQGQEYRYFKPMSSDDASGYSIYAKSDWATASVDLVGRGFDAGDANGISSVSYVGIENTPRTNYIVTNSLNTSITVNAPLDTIYHYGDAANVNIIAAANQSYHEFGYVPFITVKNGRVALEKDSKVDRMHFAYDAQNEKFDDIVVAYEPTVELPSFSRDTLDVASIPATGKLVVELQDSTEKAQAKSDFVWLYQQGLKEQIRVSETAEAAGEVKSTDQGVAAKTAQVAEDIANTLQQGYEPTQEQIASGTVDTAKVEEKGLTEEEKAEAVEQVVEAAIEEKFEDDDMADYVCRIGATGYLTFNAAYDAVETGGMTGTIVMLKDAGFSFSSRKDTHAHLSVNLNGHTLTNTGNRDFRPHTDSIIRIFDNSGLGTGAYAVPNLSNAFNILNNAEVYLENITVTSKSGPITGSGTGVVSIKNCTVTSGSKYSAGVSAGGTVALTIEDSTITGGPAVSISSNFNGTACIDGCDLIGMYSAILTIQGSNADHPILVKDSNLSVASEGNFAPGVYLQSNAKVVNLTNVVIDMANNLKSEQYAIRMTSEGVSTINVTDSEFKNVVGYGICMDMDGYGDANFYGTKITTTEETVEMDHPNGHTHFYSGCNLITGQSDIYYTVNGSMTTVHQGVTLNVNPGESNYKYTVDGFVHDNGDGTWSVTQQVWDWYVTPEGTANYKVDQFGNHVDVTNTWQEILGSGDHPESWKLNENTGLYEESESLGLAKRGDTVHFANGTYTIGGKIYTPDGVTIIGESKTGTIIEASEGVHAHGDLTVKNLTFGTQVGGGNYWIVRPNTVGLNSDTTPVAEDILKEADYDFYFENVVFNYYQESQRNYGPYQAGHGDLTIKNCEFVNLRNAICGLTSDGTNTIVITGNTFTNIRTEVIGFNESDALNAEVVAQWYADNYFDETSDGKIVGYGANSSQTVYPHNN